MPRAKENSTNEHHAMEQQEEGLGGNREVPTALRKDLTGRKDIIAQSGEQSTLQTEIFVTTVVLIPGTSKHYQLPLMGQLSVCGHGHQSQLGVTAE